MKFTEFDLHPDLQKGIAKAGYVTCMPVQEQVLTHAFNGQDLYVQSQTGTGKTAAFLAVIFQRLLAEDMLAGKKALIMAPTRELAVQIEEEAKTLGEFLSIKTGSFYGGVGYAQQEKLLRENVRILVGTPGRVLDLNKSGKMNLMDIAFLVLDEADRMFDMGFYPDLRKLIKVVPPADRRQTMLFSATLNAYVKNLAWEYTRKPFEIEITPEVVTVEEVEQVLYHVPSGDKMRLLLGILEREKPESAIIFCNTKRYTEIAAKRLRLNGFDCDFIIGDLPQSRRLKVIDDVKAGKTKILVATDVAARGLDIEGLAMVINYDLPAEAENYVHRIGRTARAGKTGRAVTLASEQDVYELPAIERYIGKKIPSEIAAPELYAQDKSAGQSIRAEDYGGRADGNRQAGRETHRQGRKPESRRSSIQSGTKKGNAAGIARHMGSPHAGKDRPVKDRLVKGRRDSTRSAGRESSQGAQDISRLSFDERMAVYKRKYDSGVKTCEGEPRRTPAANLDGKKAGGKTETRPAEKITGKARPGGKSAGKPQHKEKTVPQQPAPPPAKKGFLSRVLGVFKKK